MNSLFAAKHPGKDIKIWRQEIKKAKHKTANIIIVGAKKDPPKQGEATFSPLEALELAGN